MVAYCKTECMEIIFKYLTIKPTTVLPSAKPTAIFSIAVFIFLFIPVSFAQESSIRLEKPRNIFFYPQLNLQGGYDTREPGSHWGLADRGARTQLVLEWFVKDKAHQQRGFTQWIEPTSWNLKFAVEIDPQEDNQDQFNIQMRLLDTWVKLATKWDRTHLWLGHKSIPYGHNPKLDPSHAFMPNQSELDLSFGRDTGLFLKTPVSQELDLEFSATLGKGDTWDHYGGWLLTGRVGSPTFKPNEFGMFALTGKIQNTRGTINTDGNLTSVYRVGADWIHKHRELWKATNQVSVGDNKPHESGDRFVLGIYNSLEWYLHPKWTAGITHNLRYENLYGSDSSRQTTGALLGTISYTIGRDTRFRVNPFFEYQTPSDGHHSGVLFQLCFGCGLTR